MSHNYVLYKVDEEDDCPMVCMVAEGMEAVARANLERDGCIVLPVVVLSVEEHKQLLHAQAVADVVKKFGQKVIRG